MPAMNQPRKPPIAQNEIKYDDGDIETMSVVDINLDLSGSGGRMRDGSFSTGNAPAVRFQEVDKV